MNEHPPADQPPAQPPVPSTPPPPPPQQAPPSPYAASMPPMTPPGADPTPPPPAPAAPVAVADEPPASPPPPPPASTSRSGNMLPFLLAAAIIPAIIVGAIVYVIRGGSEASAGGAGIVDGFIRLGSSGDQVVSYGGKAPPNYPTDLPAYSGTKPVASFAVESTQGTNYFVVYSTKDPVEKVYDYFLAALDSDPWQVELARSSSEFTGLRFSRPDDADVEGDITIHQSSLDNRTSIYVSFQDLTPDGASSDPERKGAPSFSRPLPPGFPGDIPIYDSSGPDTIVADTYFERAAGSTSYIISFLTKDNQSDVLKFYTDEFTKRGWSVTDSSDASQTQGFAQGIDFTDGPRQQVQGSIQTDTFADDSSYIKVDMLLQVSSSRPRGN